MKTKLGGMQIGKGFNQLNVSETERRLNKRATAKARRRLLKNFEITRFVNRYRGYAS